MRPGSLPCRLWLHLPLGLVLWTAVQGSLWCQQAAIQGKAQASADALKTTSAVQAAFVSNIRALGLSCTLPVPKISVEDVPSFGNYSPDTNILRTSDWSMLSAAERAFAYQLVPPGADEATAKATFNDVAHRWIFVHEMGHWWQNCHKANFTQQPYKNEYEADRIAAAYWNGVDPSLVTKIMALAQAVLNHTPYPVPAGQLVERYFNAHYQTLGPSPAYPWFQARMIMDCGKQTPQPTFAETLATP